MQKQIFALASDDGSMVMWDMDALLADCGRLPYITLPTAGITPRSWLAIDEEYAMGTDTEAPVILFELPEKLFCIADGNHRLFRAAAEGLPTMKAILLPQDVHLHYLYQSTVGLYSRVIAGLRNEGIFIENPLHEN